MSEQTIELPRCENCQFWSGTTIKQFRPRGKCLRHAPRPDQSEKTSIWTTVWPITYAENWCGEHKPTESA